MDDSGHVKVRLCHIRCGSVALVRLCGISAALRETRVLVSSSEMSARSSTSAKVQIDYRLRYAHTRTRAAHSKLPVDPCATRSL